MLSVIFAKALLAAIQLTGVTGDKLKTRAFFDANNVKVGDPLVLTVDFIGEADFASLHPPALARSVDHKDWKIDDASAKTDTYRDARRLTYRVRPMREGVLWFPELEFSYFSKGGEERTVRSNAIPVHAKKGDSVVVEGLAEDLTVMPDPGELETAAPAGLTEDEMFDWRKACTRPTADAFAEFDFPAAKLNEARCAIREGDAKRALKIYSQLEWKIGQTPEIERGIVAALARRFDNPAVELPVWRQVGRPVLKYPFWGRVGLVLGTLAGAVVVLLLVGKAIRKLAAIALAALVLLPAAGLAQGFDPFAEIEAMQRRMHEQMNRMMGGGGGQVVTVGGRGEKPVITVTAKVDRKAVTIGETFNYFVYVESPRNCRLDNLRLQPSETYAMKLMGQVANLADGKSANTNNVVRRFMVPVRYDVPFKAKLHFTVTGSATVESARNRRGGFFSFVSSEPFKAVSPLFQVEVKPLPTENQPKDFSGIVATSFEFSERADSLCVGTNDVILLTHTLKYDGYVPEDWAPPGVGYEMRRGDGFVEWRRYFVADGRPSTPEIVIEYYEPKTKKYKKAEGGRSDVRYRE